jgi:sec-independent protein translocase protein TatB
MFDFSWSQIMLIGVVALVLIGPKDLPIALRAISNMIKKARAMAAEFHTHVDDMMKSVDLKDVKDQFNDIRNFDLRNEIEKAVDPDRKLRDTFSADPLNPGATTDGAFEAAMTTPAPPEPPVTPPPDPNRAHAPAFIPPAFVAPITPITRSVERPAFIPPEISRPS